jgi:DNA-directed RNA polymerase specialized sigma24 family protein
MLPSKNTHFHWPAREDHLVIAEMLASSESDNWTTCLAYVSRRVSIQARHLPRDYWDDITQDVMLLIVRNLPRFRGHSRLTTWIIRIVRNCTCRFFHGYLFLPFLTDSLSDPSTRQKLRNRQRFSTITWTLEEEYILREDLRSAFVELARYIKTHPQPHRNARILEAVLFQRQPVPAVAKELHCSIDVVRHVIRAARKYVYQKLLADASRIVQSSIRRANRSRRENGFYPL